MLDLKEKTSFKRQIKKYKNQHDVLNILKQIVGVLVNENKLDSRYNDHALKGKFFGKRELHLKPDVLLIYEKIPNVKIVLIAIGSHSELF